MMRIISGKLKGKRLSGPIDNSIRPTSDRAKEMIFNTLNSFFVKDNITFDDSIILDIFCGTGALGIEAISRGAKKSIFIDNSNYSLEICKKNCEKLNINHLSEIINLDVKESINIFHKRQIDIFFCDPPYDKFSIDLLLDKIKVILNKNAYGVIELSKKNDLIEFKNFKLLKVKYISNSKFCFVQKN